MKKQVLWKDFLDDDKDIVINCQTEEQANELLKLLYEKGVTWFRGASLLKDNAFNEYKENTCYKYEKKNKHIGICYSHIDTYSTPKCSNYDFYTIYKYSEIELVDKISKIAIEIDPTNKEAAHKAVEKAIAEYNNKPKDWTEEEIQQARRITEDLILNLHDDGLSPVFYYYKEFKKIICTLKVGNPFNDVTYRAFPKENHIFNKHIGRCVAICHVAGKPVPDFIKNKNKGV